jgi:hypothetical protein
MSQSITKPDSLPHAALQKIFQLRNIPICLQPENFLRLACGFSQKIFCALPVAPLRPLMTITHAVSGLNPGTGSTDYNPCTRSMTTAKWFDLMRPVA